MYINRIKELVNINLIRRGCHNIYNNHRLNDFPATFQSKDVEEGWYEVWEENKYFQPDDSKGKSYSMILPPPNITGTLHLGHALTATVQDVLARWQRMKGVSVVWIPGFDHAGIATQAVVEKFLFKTKGLKRAEMTKEQFLAVVNKWKNEKSRVIEDQLRTLGASLDWSREYFTISANHNRAVTEAFVALDKMDLLYRDKSLVNWSPTLGSALSDIEVDFENLSGKTELEIPGYERKVTFGQIFEISYDVKNTEEKLTVATTRPETLPGDVALAVHPNDSRYSKFIGRQVSHPLKKNCYIPVIADPDVKMDFGTGVVKITPAHDKFDHEIAKRHNLEVITVFNETGKLNKNAGSYTGLPRFHARSKILTDLTNSGSLISVKDHEMQIPRCSRTGDIIELMLKEQWFIRCKAMAQKALEAVESGKLTLNPSFHHQTWYNWLSNIRDWCVSRQLWWGHQIPAYQYRVDDLTQWVIAKSREEAQEIVRYKFGPKIKVQQQDTDVLDTWFSSALLPFSSLGWPTNEKEYQKYYPLNMMETGHDILFFWVARMVMLGLELTNELPFREVLLHGVLCDAQGKKMSKSRGNVILPENVIEGISLEKLNEQAQNSFETGILNQTELKRTLSMNKKMFPNGIPECGVDALRFSLCSHNIKERTVTFNITECEQNKFFCNKIWQASKYVLLMTNDDPIEIPKTFTILDKWILSRLACMVQTVNDELENKNFYKVVSAIKEFLYYEFCDYYVEGTKAGFKSAQEDILISQRYTLAKCLEVSLRVLAPITPYLCDDLYARLSEKLSIFQFQNSLLESSYPIKEEFENLRDINLENSMKEVIKVILSIRTLLGNVSKKDNVQGYIVVNTEEDQKLYEESLNVISSVSRLNNIQIIPVETYQNRENSICDNIELNCSVYLTIDDETVLNQARDRINKKRIQAQKKLEDLVRKTHSKNYVEKKSEEEKLKDQEKISVLQEELKRIPVST